MLLGKNEGLAPLMPLDVCYYPRTTTPPPPASMSFCDYKEGLFYIFFLMNSNKRTFVFIVLNTSIYLWENSSTGRAEGGK